MQQLVKLQLTSSVARYLGDSRVSSLRSVVKFITGTSTTSLIVCCYSVCLSVLDTGGGGDAVGHRVAVHRRHSLQVSPQAPADDSADLPVRLSLLLTRRPTDFNAQCRDV